MSSDLIWQLVKDNNSFLVKRGRTARLGAVQFSKEPGNLLGVNSFKYSGIATAQPIVFNHSKSGVTVTTKDAKLWNKPSKSSTTTQLKLNTKSALKVIKSTANSSSYRADLTAAASARYLKLYRDVKMKRGLVRPTKTSTGRKSKSA